LHKIIEYILSITSAKEVMFSSLVVCLSVSNFAQKNFEMDLHEIFREDKQWLSEQMIKFWWRSGSKICIRILIATLVRCTLVEPCTVSVLLDSIWN